VEPNAIEEGVKRTNTREQRKKKKKKKKEKKKKKRRMEENLSKWFPDTKADLAALSGDNPPVTSAVLSCLDKRRSSCFFDISQGRYSRHPHTATALQHKLSTKKIKKRKNTKKNPKSIFLKQEALLRQSLHPWTLSRRESDAARHLRMRLWALSTI
jgi:hypothetical protein